MNNKIALEIKSILSEKSFSFDTLILKTKELFDQKGIPGFLELLLSIIDEHALQCVPELIKEDLKQLRTTDKRRKHYCCSEPSFIKNGRADKKFRTSIGELNYSWRRLRCQNCSKSFTPLKSFLKIETNQRKSNELEKLVMDIISEQSYRKTVSHIKLNRDIKLPHTTAHRWVMASDADEIDPSDKSVDIFITDGTGFKQIFKYRNDQSNRGEVKIALGIDKNKKIIPYGAWTEESWGRIGQKIKNANHKNKKLKFKPIANVLVSDGEEKMIRAMGRLTQHTQRCQWHMTHELPSSLRYQDGLELDKTRVYQKKLNEIISIKLPENNFEEMNPDDQADLIRKLWQAQKSIDELEEEFRSKGYKKAAGYIKNSKANLFNYLRFWMKTGIACPKTSSMIERIMREVGRRIKKIGHGWSPKGAAKMTRIILKKITSAKEWEKYWEDKLEIDDSVKLELLGCRIV
jgi:hypothetical protein